MLDSTLSIPLNYLRWSNFLKISNYKSLKFKYFLPLFDTKMSYSVLVQQAVQHARDVSYTKKGRYFIP